jgi:L-seryl-tRNA(Ser) seleniumtransferase
VTASADARRRLPQVERLARLLEADAGALPRPALVDAVRTVVEAARRRARRSKTVPTEEELVAMCRDELRRRRANLLRPVINATGVVLHTNLGRAPLTERAIEAVVQIARGYSNLEFDTEHGRRGDRHAHVEPLLALATGAEAALVVNNNAGAVLLVCAALAAGREVVVSRGELIEIGGEFRIPDILATSGATLREVGTTNRTHLRDYERAIGDDTSFVLKVHPSNYRVVGFTTDVDTANIAAVARRHRVPLVYDVGSGLLERALADEPTVVDALRDGADLVCFSGDKLFGGPQAGIVVGRGDLVAALRSHPLVRALRPDKMQLAALGATCVTYLEGTAGELPVWQMLDATPDEIAPRAGAVARRAAEAGFDAEVTTGDSVAGGGSLPGEAVPTVLVRLRHPEMTAVQVAASLRERGVIARVDAGRVVLDLRTVLPGQDGDLSAALSTP